jgi:micrococcal nuclease
LAAVLLSYGLFIVQQHGGAGNLGAKLATNQPGTYAISHFVDGDTIAVAMNGQVEKVRLIGVDTPETHKPNTPVQCYGPAAAAYTKTRIGQQRVRLVADALSTDRDRYGRLLRYVYLPDGTNLDEALIQNGYGFYYPYFPFTKSTRFAADEQTAITAHKGLWANCHPQPTDHGGYVSNPLNT